MPFLLFEASAAHFALAILPRPGPVGQRLPNTKADSYITFPSHGKGSELPIGRLPTLGSRLEF
jgi:hypothetical protein